MTGKRARALPRTASVSQLGSQEFSPLCENPKEKLKPTPVKEPVKGVWSGVSGSGCAPRVVIGFDPKPTVRGGSFNVECAADSPKSAPCSPCFNDKASSPRSVLNSLFSRQRCVKPSDGVGLGIALHAPHLTLTTPITTIPDEIVEKLANADHIAIPVRDDTTIAPFPVVHSRRHSHPIPTPGISACHFPHHDATTKAAAAAPPQPKPQQAAAACPVLAWPEQVALKVDRRDTFLLAASPSRSLSNNDSLPAFPSSSHFLDECSFCKRHLPEDKDIFMYRGDKAFCSVECRSQQMLMDERSKNCSSSALKRGPGVAVPSQRACVGPASPVAAA